MIIMIILRIMINDGDCDDSLEDDDDYPEDPGDDKPDDRDDDGM